MGEIACSRCTVEVEQEQECVQAYDADDNVVDLAEVIAVAAERGVDAGAVVFYARDEVDHPALPEYTFRSAVIPVTVRVPTAFEGTEQEALAVGWEVREYGMVCPDCARSERDDTGATATMEGDNPLIEIASAVMLGGKLGARAIRARKQKLAEGLVDMALGEQDE